MRPDFTFYIDDGQMLLRPENTRARSHLEKNETEYGKWLVWFYFGNGSSILLPKEDTDAFFVRPGRDIGPLADALVPPQPRDPRARAREELFDSVAFQCEIVRQFGVPAPRNIIFTILFGIM